MVKEEKYIFPQNDSFGSNSKVQNVSLLQTQELCWIISSFFVMDLCVSLNLCVFFLFSTIYCDLNPKIAFHRINFVVRKHWICTYKLSYPNKFVNKNHGSAPVKMFASLQPFAESSTSINARRRRRRRQTNVKWALR